MDSANGDSMAKVIIPLLQALNTYNHNNTLLGQLIKGDNASAAINNIEQKLLQYVQGLGAAQVLTGTSSASDAKTNLGKLQAIIDRYQYLEGLSNQVTTAMANNPFALLAGQQAVVGGGTFQNAATNLYGNILSTTGRNELFNQTGASTYGAASTMAQSLSTMENTINANSATINAWNTYVGETSGGTQTNLQNMATSVTNIAGYVANASLSGGTLNSVASTTTNADSALSSVTAGIFQNSGGTAATSLTWGGSSGANTAAVYGALNAIDQLNNWFGGGLGGANFTKFQNATGKLSDLSTQVNSLLDPLTAATPQGFIPDNIQLGSQDSVGFLNNVLGALQGNTAINTLLGSSLPTSLSASQLSALQQVLNPILGTTNTDYLVSGNGANALTFLTAAQKIIADVGTIATNVDSAGTSLNLKTLQGQLQAAQDINGLYNTVQGALVANGNGNDTIVGNSATGFTNTTWEKIEQAIDTANELKSTINITQSFITYITSNADDTSAMPASLQAATSFLGVVASELKAMGVSPNSTTSVGNYISAATPAQIAQVVAKIEANAGTANALTTPSMDAQAMASVFGDVLKNAKAYNTAESALGTSGTTSGANATARAINNANSVQQLMKVLKGVSNGTYSSADLTNALNLLKNMGNVAQVVTQLQTSNSAAAQEARNIQQASNNTNQATTLLEDLTRVTTAVVGTQTPKEYMDSKAQAYLAIQNNAQNGQITVQANILAANGAYNLATVLNSLQTLSQGSFASGTVATGIANSDMSGISGAQIASSLNDLNKSIISTYNYLGFGSNPNPSVNADQARSMLENLVSQIGSLQREVVNMLVALNNGVYDASLQATNTDLAAKGGTFAFLKKGFGQTTPMSPTARQTLANDLKALLLQINKSKLYSQAALKKYNSNLSVQFASRPTTRHMQTSTQNGNMYGIDMQFGYKQFFGKKKRWGLRYYASFSYQHGTFNVGDASDVDNFVYGAGVDALYNFFESKDGNMTSGVFAGLMLAGSTWNVKGMSYYKSLMADWNANGGKASMNTSYFQIPINIGFRTNVNRHNGFEIGLRIPLATNYFFNGVNADGDRLQIAYKRNVSVFFNYVYNF